MRVAPSSHQRRLSTQRRAYEWKSRSSNTNQSVACLGLTEGKEATQRGLEEHHDNSNGGSISARLTTRWTCQPEG